MSADIAQCPVFFQKMKIYARKLGEKNDYYPFHDEGRYRIETSPLICGVNQWTGVYMMLGSVMKGLNCP